MRFRCERDTLAELIGTAQRAVATRAGANPVLSGVQLTAGSNGLTAVGSDLELTIRATAPARVETPGTAVVPARLVGDIVRALDADEVSVGIDGEQAQLTTARSSFTVRVLSPDDFPRIGELDAPGVRVDAGALSEALRQVVPAASRDDSRPILTGVLLTATGDGLRLVATDSYRLAVRDLPGVSVLAEGQKVLVAAKGLSEVQRLLGHGEIETIFGTREVRIRVGSTEVTTRLIEGEFPNYEQLIPSGYPNRLMVHRDALVEAAKRVRLVGQGRENAPLRLAMGAEGLELSAIAQDVGEARETVDAKYEGNDLTVAFNADYLLDGLLAAGNDEVVIETVDALKPATIRGVDRPEYLYLIMPMRVS